MSVMDQIQSHRSIRKFKPDPIPNEILSRILAAGIRSPSSGNLQSYSIIVTEDETIRKKLLTAHHQQKMVIEAPLLLTFCADLNRTRVWLRSCRAPDNFDNFFGFLMAAVDAVLVSQTTALAAESLGFGICYLGSTLSNCQQIGEILQLPEMVVPIVGYTLGYPAEDPPLRVRLPLEGLVHQDRYQPYQESNIRSIYQEKEREDWNRYMASSRLRKLVEEKNVESLAELYTAVKYTKEEYQQISQQILTYLSSQALMNNNA